MSDSLLVTLISLGATGFFLIGVPVLLVIGLWVIGMSMMLGLPLDNLGSALSDVFTDGFALLAMPLFILTGDLINQSGIARRMSDFAYSCLGWLRGCTCAERSRRGNWCTKRWIILPIFGKRTSSPISCGWRS